MKTITLIIEGTMCQNCRSHVDKALGISGVAANVSLEEKKAKCTGGRRERRYARPPWKMRLHRHSVE
ncbi:MAG: heavy-metal-associated domain-containing protein [Ruthenibacterium lactatiformans]